ncbi:hypothetical protein MMC28_006425 [Mycoblastus sanguinarius]|nr:hypothetical protein [Mycoblastus sanguinarius]
MNGEAYQYSQLEHRQIRLLKLFRDDATQLRWELLQVPLDDLPVKYKAVSYTWGDATPVSQITSSDGRFLKLTAPAADFLDFGLAAKAEGYFWIDSLCINQQDLEEKAHQVRMMGEIFASAEHVVAWLGRASEDSSLAIDFVITLYGAIKNLTVTEKVPVTRDSLCRSPLCEHPSPKWTALRRLLERPWFNRVWVVQEIVMAPRNVILVCGDKGILWDILAAVLSLIHVNYLSVLLLPVDYAPGSVMADPGGMPNTVCIYALKIMRASKQPLSLQSGLSFCVRFDSTDPRDKLYAVIGLANDADDPLLHPDYRANVREIFTSSSKYMLAANTSLRILHFAGIGRPRLIADLPSWVADWSAWHQDTVFGDIADTAGYRASGSLPSCFRADMKPNVVTCKGIILDAVTSCISQPSTNLSWQFGDAEIKEYRSALLRFYEKLGTLVSSSQYYQQGGFNKDVL